MAKSAAVSDLDKFVHLLEKSALLSPEQLTQVREAASGHENAKALARYIAKNDLVTKWQAAQLLGGFYTFRIGKYLLLSQLGSGEHGRSYLAEHASMGRKVVLRTLPRRSAERPELLKKFLTEAQAASALDHRNINHVYDVNSEGDRYYLVMEYVAGRNLFDIVSQDGPLAPSQAADYIRQAAEGLAHAHKHGVIHRELSPGKLIVDEQGQVKILEMGIAGLDEPSETASTDISGGATSAGAYLAPEQCQASPEADERTDIYSLGASLYYMLSGKSPLAPSGAEKPKDVLQLRSDVPESLVELCQQMMAARSSDRFASAKELLSALEKWLAAQRPAAPPVRRKAPPAPPTEEPAASQGGGKPGSGKQKVKVAKSLDAPPTAPAASESNAFFIDTGPKKKKKAKPVAEESAPASEDQVAPADNGEKKPLPMAIIIGAAAGALGLVILIGVVVAFMMMGGDEKKVAKNSDTKTTETKKGDETKPVAPPETKPEEKPMPMPIAPMAEEKKPDPEPMPEVKPEPMPVPEVKPEPAPPAPEPKPEEKLEPKPEPKPEPKAEPKPMVEPFAEVAKSVELPSLGTPAKPNPAATTPISIATVKLDPAMLLFPKLIGGEKATAGKATFNMASANGGTAERAWEITSTDARAGAQVVAKLELKEDQLMFEWTQPAVQTVLNSSGLMNCALELTHGPKSHVIALRKPIEASALSLNFEKPQSRTEATIPYLPDPAAIKVEIVKIETPVPGKADKMALAAEKDTAAITFGEKAEDQMLIARLDVGLKKDKLSLIASPYLKGDAAPTKFELKKFVAAKNGLTAEQNTLFAQIEALRKAKAPKETIDKADLAMNQLNERMNKYNALQSQLETLATDGRVQFRVYYAASESVQVDLVSTTAAAGDPGKLPADGFKLNLGEPKD